MKCLNKIQFEKYHGNGNDFIFLPSDVLRHFKSKEHLQQFAREICNRCFSVGADGVVFYDMSSCNRFKVLIINSDGSFANTCGNALRCLGLRWKQMFLKKQETSHVTLVDVFRLVPSFFFQDSHQEDLDVLTSEDAFATLCIDGSESIGVFMGTSLQVMPTPLRENTLADFGQDMDFLTPIFVQLANPHWVFLSKKFHQFDMKMMEKFGQCAQQKWVSKLLSGQTIPLSNISMIALPDDPLSGVFDLTVYERGAGLTQCCGSGATASRAALESVGLIDSNAPAVFFQMPGGKVSIGKKEHHGQLQWVLQGPASFVFSGQKAL